MMKQLLVFLFLVSSIASADTPSPISILQMRPGSCSTGFVRGGGSLSCSILGSSDIPSSITSNTSGNASTASALASAPSQCGGSQLSIGVLANGNAVCVNPPTAGVWGAITGTLSNQTDLQSALNGKQASGSYITQLTGDVLAVGPGSTTATLATVATPGTSAKVTYDAKGRVTSGTSLSSGDIPNNAANTTGTAANVTGSSNSTLTTLSALSLPYSQISSAPASITQLNGDVAAIGPGNTTATIQSNTVSNSKLAQGGAYTFKGNNTSSTANESDLQSLILGIPGFSDTGLASQITGSTNGYFQSIIQNTSNGSAASGDLIVNNDQGTATTHYIDVGMNSSGFTGSGSLNIAGAGYLYTQTGDLVLGTGTANVIHFITNGATTDAMSIAVGGTTTIQNLVVSGGHTNTGATSITGAVFIGAGETVAGLGTFTDLSVGGASTLTGATSITGAIFGGAGSTITGASEIGGGTLSGGLLTFADLKASGASTLTGGTSITGQLSVGGGLVLAGSTSTGLIAQTTGSLLGGTTNTGMTGLRVIGLGSSTALSITTGADDTFIGNGAGIQATTGSFDVEVGNSVAAGGTTASAVTAMGFQTLKVNTANSMTGGGYQAMLANTSGTDNTAFGVQTLLSNSTGTDNTAVGFQACQPNATNGSYNTCIGSFSTTHLTFGGHNTAVGYSSNDQLTGGSDNTALGFDTLLNANGNSTNQNTAVGSSAGNGGATGSVAITTGSTNTLVGFQSNTSSATATGRTAIGANSVSLADNTIQLGATTTLGVSIGNTTAGPQEMLDVQGLIRMKPQGSGVTPTCTAAQIGAAAWTNGMVLCGCNGSSWVKAVDGSTACTF